MGGHVEDAEGFWDAHHARHEGSLAPNAILVAEISDLPSGTALDLGCGEGADAVWLAQRGWRATGVDISAVALARAAGHAEAAGVTDRVTWERHDLDASFPAGDFDLVTTHYLHSPHPMRRALALERAVRAVAPGGTLLVVGHASVAPWSWEPHVELPSARQVLDDLAVGHTQEWQVVVCHDRTREAIGPQGEVASVTGSVVRLTRAA